MDAPGTDGTTYPICSWFAICSFGNLGTGPFPFALKVNGPFRFLQWSLLVLTELGVFLLWNTTNVHFYTFLTERFPAFRLMYSAGQIACGESAMPHRNDLNLDSNDNAAIRREIGERLRVLLSKEQPSPPPRVQHLLDRLSTLDATGGR